MNCYNHPDKEAICRCENCWRLICADCRTLVVGKPYCKACADELAARTTEYSGLSWFRRHLNWTMILACFGGGLILLIAAATAAETRSASGLVAVGLLVILGVCMVWGWALRKKGRSLWWIPLFLLLQIWGLLLFFYLENRNRTPEEPPQSRMSY